MLSVFGNFGCISFDEKKMPMFALSLSCEMDDDIPVTLFVMNLPNFSVILHEYFDMFEERDGRAIIETFIKVIHLARKSGDDDITIDLDLLITQVLEKLDEIDAEEKKKKKRKSPQQGEKKNEEKVIQVDFSKKKKD